MNNASINTISLSTITSLINIDDKVNNLNVNKKIISSHNISQEDSMNLKS
jgi:hypothetical protein